MRINKKLFMAVAVVASVLVVFSSCKKGEGDPFLSLSSRKARVAGEWNINNWMEQSAYNGTSTSAGSVSTYNGTEKLEINGTSLTINSTSEEINDWGTFNYTTTGTGTANATMKLDKNGTFVKTMEFQDVTMTMNDGSSTSTMTVTQSVTTSGTWNFLGGVEQDYKNKERIILNITNESVTYDYNDAGYIVTGKDDYTYSNGEYSEVWHLSTLKNKEMIMDGDRNSTSLSNYTTKYFGLTETSKDDYKSTGSISGTFIQ